MATADFIAPSTLPATASISCRQPSVSEHLAMYRLGDVVVVVEEANLDLPKQITIAALKAMGIKFRLIKMVGLPEGRPRKKCETARAKQPVAA